MCVFDFWVKFFIPARYLSLVQRAYLGDATFDLLAYNLSLMIIQSLSHISPDPSKTVLKRHTVLREKVLMTFFNVYMLI